MTPQIWQYTWTFYFYSYFYFYHRFLQPNKWKVSYEQMLCFSIIWTPNIAVFEAYQLQSILCRHCVNGICLKYEPKVWTEHGRTALNRTEQNRTTGTACLGILFCLPLARFVLSRLVFRTCETNDQILYHASFSCRFELYGISALLLSHFIFDVLWTSMRFYYLSFKFIIDELQRSLLWSTTKNSFRWFAQSPFIFQADQIESSSKKGPKSWVAQQFTPLW